MAILPLPGFFEPVSAIMHLIAAGVFAYLGIRLIHRGRADHRGPLRITLLSIFVIASVFMLSMSGVYHLLDASGTASVVMYRLDMASIFVLIAGTFTAVHGMYFRGAARWVGLILMWLAAITGLLFTVIFLERIPWGVSTMMYLLLGWIASISVLVAWREHGWRYIRPIIYGGVAYSIGAILLELNWPTIIPGVIGPHEVWHIAVLIGLSLHWKFVARQARQQRGGAGEPASTAPRG